MPIRRKPITSNCTPAIPETLEDAKGCKVYIDTVANQCWLTAETEPNGMGLRRPAAPVDGRPAACARRMTRRCRR